MYINLFIYSYIKPSIFLLASIIGNYCYANNNKASIPNVLDNNNILQNSWVPYIKSVKTYKVGLETNSPTIELNSNATIRFEFDDLSEEGLSYDYTLIHCTYDWRPSGLLFNEYADGFAFNQVNNFTNSQGTSTSYLHYSLDLPNDNIKIKLSGNYILQIVNSYDHGNVILQQRFVVFENILGISASVIQPQTPNLRFTSQQIELEVDYSALGNIDPDNDIVVSVDQDYQELNALNSVKPTFINNGKINYSSENSLIFDGGNEFRNLNIKSFYYQTPQIQKFENYGGEFHLELAPDENLSKQRYTENPDINGKFMIKRDDSNNSNIEAEYLWVYFTLPYSYELENSDVYIFGELSGWTINPLFKLNYDLKSSAYETRLQLKQGFYNYKYVVVDKTSGKCDLTRFEGNFFDTENVYQIMVYYKQQGSRYWRLVGFNSISSRYKT